MLAAMRENTELRASAPRDERRPDGELLPGEADPEFDPELLELRPELLLTTPRELITPDVLRAACLGDGRALAFVPPAMRSLEACLAALRATPLALAFVPGELLAAPEIRAAVRTGPTSFEGLWPYLVALSPQLAKLRAEMDDEDFWQGV